MQITVVGAANIDIITKSKEKIVPGNSNPSEVKLAAGGVGRNIASLLAKRGMDVRLITAVGSDPLGTLLKDSCDELGINTESWIIKDNMSTGAYLATLENDGELYAAFNAMNVPESIRRSEITKHKAYINDADLLILDLNLSEKILAHCLELRGDGPVLVDVVSAAKAHRIADMLDKVSILKLNRLEAEQLTGIKLDTKERVKQACFILVNKGVKRVFITLGMAGVCACEKQNAIFVPALPVAIKDVTGAGDAFAAGIALSIGKTLRAQAQQGINFATEHLKQIVE
ncbi:MAG: carbohydrate kinase family protein [Oscillospiraceae bacterium]|nr:carbohydrate kinase family protein [Oscillospiraceae bacterium]MCL2277981.1 carbohydrate kinase family protein [Oscillospiraceae bacterium]